MQCSFCSLCQNFKALSKKKKKLTSWKVQDELIKIIADLVTEIIVGKIFDTGHFAKMVDEVKSHKNKKNYLYVCA